MKRVALYCFYDDKGVVRDFVIEYLKGLTEVCNEIWCICNCKLTVESKEKLCKIPNVIVYERPNVGYDVLAWKDTMEKIGWNTIRKYDEMILCNYTCYGPFYPFSDMFKKMDDKKCDFWGIAKHPEQNTYLLPNKEGYVYEHIMSYFIVVRSDMLHSNHFKDYWMCMPEIKTKSDAVGYNETRFTKYFKELGYKEDTFIDFDSYKNRCYNSSIILAYDLLAKSKCPLVKRRAFFFPNYDGLLQQTDTHKISELIKYIDNNTNYNVDLIWDDILETQKMSSLVNNMHLNWVVQGKCQINKNDNDKIAIIIYIPNEMYFNILVEYINPNHEYDLFIICDDNVQSYLVEFEETYNFTTRKLKNRYRVGLTSINDLDEIRDKYDYLACILEYNSITQEKKLAEEDWVRYIYSNMLGEGETYQKNIVNILEENKRVGALLLEENDFASYYGQNHSRFKKNKSDFQDAYEQMELAVPFDDVIYTNGELCFWIKSSVLGEVISTINNKFDILNEHNCLAFFMPILVQQSGFASGKIINDRYAALNIGIQHYYKNYLIDKMKRECGVDAWSFFAYMNNIKKQEKNTIVYKEKTREELLNVHYSLKEIVTILKKYPHNWIEYKKNKKVKTEIKVYTYLKNITIENNRVILYFMSGKDIQNDSYLLVGGKKYYALKNIDFAMADVQKYVKEYTNAYVAFFSLPISDVKDTSLKMFGIDGEQINFRWSDRISYNALEMAQLDIHTIILDGELFFYSKKKTKKLMKNYSLKDRILYFALKNNIIHNVTLMSENLGAADNTYQLFKTAIDNGEKKTFYIVSREYYESKEEDKYKRKMIIHNSKKHHFLQAFSSKWIGSYSLRNELLTTTDVYKDIHYSFIPAKWFFIPHGMAVGDKNVAMLYKWAWDNPYATYANAQLERNTYANKYQFKNVYCVGSPRMDKWHNDNLDKDSIIIFFTWRMGLSKGRLRKEEDYENSNYYKTIIKIVSSIKSHFPDKKLTYVFHHEVVKAGIDNIIKNGLKEFDIDYIYFNNNLDVKKFNEIFRDAKYLITDFSSVAYDFSSKSDSIVIYYLDDKFIEYHYPLENAFFDIQLGEIAHNCEELIDKLSLKHPSDESINRRKKFFYKNDNQNSQRVYDCIFNDIEIEKPLNNQEIIVKHKKYSKRLNLYFFYDEEGIVDEYIFYYLKCMKNDGQEICFIVNGNIKPKYLRRIKQMVDKVIVRQNIGFDSGAYREALFSYGFEKIKEYDELILNNFTFYGPLFDIEEMFEKMNTVECDFWGHNKYIASDKQKFDGIPMPDHLQSYFIVFRKSILESNDFKEYWVNLKLPSNYSEAVRFHELKCTEYFEKLGYISSEFIPYRAYGSKYGNTPMHLPLSQIRDYRSPFLKRKVFAIKGGKFEFPLWEDNNVYELVDYINKYTNYDSSLILDNIKRTYNIDSLNKNIDSSQKINLEMEKMKKEGIPEYKINIYKNAPVDSEKLLNSFEK